MMGKVGSATCLLLAVSVTACGGPPPAPGPTLPQRETVDVTQREVPGSPTPPASDAVKRGEALLASGDAAAARRAFDEAVAADPDDPRAYLDLGIALEMLDELEEAEAAYRKAVAIEPDFAQALNNLGLLLLDTKRAQESVALLQRATKADPELADAWVNLALALEATGQRDDAVGAWARAAALAPGDASVRANLGLAQLVTGDRAAARQTLRDALPVARGNAAALLAIGNGLRRAGDAEGAVEAMQAAVEAHEGGPTPALLAELALAQNAAGRGADAEATLGRALDIDAGYATAHYLLGSMLAGRGAYREAIAHLNEAIALEPRGPHADEARKRLKAARQALKKHPKGK